MVVWLKHDEPSGRDLATVTIERSTINHGGSGFVELLDSVDIDAVLEASTYDLPTQRHLRAAAQSMRKADEAARKAHERAASLSAKARAKRVAA